MQDATFLQRSANSRSLLKYTSSGVL